MPEKFYIIDGTALVYRSYFAFIQNPLYNSKGENTSAAYGFANAVIRLLKDEKPDYFAIAFDRSEPTFRHEMYEEYKATREKMPDELVEQLPRISQIVEVLNIKTLEIAGYEADDIIGTLALRAADAGLDVYVVTGDKDLMQLVNDKIYWVNLRKTGQEPEILGPEGVREKFGVLPEQVVDVLSLMGDSSDNVPGVAGVGKVTALKLINEYGSLDNIYANIDNIKQKKLKEKLVNDREKAYLSKDLVVLDCNVDVDYDNDALKTAEPDAEASAALFRDLEFRTLTDMFLKEETKKRKTEYQTVLTLNELDRLTENLRKNPFAFDTETTSLDELSAELVGLSFSWKENEAWYVPVTAPDQKPEFMLDIIIEKLKPVLEDADIPKCAQNAKYDMLVLGNYGIDVKGLSFDTMIASHLLDPDFGGNDLDFLSRKYLDIIKIPTTDLIGKGKDQKNMADIPLEKITEYACEDADCTFQLWKILEPEVRKINSLELLTGLEIPLIPVLADMEREGVRLNTSFLLEMSVDLHQKLEKIKDDVYDLAGQEFNIGSPQQLGKILFEKLEIQKEFGVKRVKKTKTGYSTNVATLEQYKSHPVVEKILEYRNLSKLVSTYVDALPKLINDRTGRIHTSFNQTIAATGRLSSTNPNLQNIPIRRQSGKEIRKAFIPRDSSWKLLAADYSQIELRIMAHLSGDKLMQEAFINGEDIHARTAASIFGLQAHEVSDEMRYRAKAINFGILYGMSSFRLARETGIANEEAASFISAYFSFYPDVNMFISNQIAKARADGYVTTMLGRRRHLPDLFSDNQRLRNTAENIAINTPLQGTAAEIIKKAMLIVAERLENEKMKSKLILQIHDELVFEAPGDEIERLREIVIDCMENAVKLDIPLIVDVNIGDNWYDAK